VTTGECRRHIATRKNVPFQPVLVLGCPRGSAKQGSKKQKNSRLGLRWSICLRGSSAGASMSFLRRILDWLAGPTIDEIPEDDAPCVFDCRKPECREADWDNCLRRLQRAEGELMLEKKPTSGSVADTTPKSDVIYYVSDWL